MCAGLRDDWNLAWKLDLVLDGKADDRLLDSYQPERRPHVSDVIDLSMYLGRVICIPDADKAAERDEAFFSGKAPPPPAFPSLTDGILRRDDEGTVQAPAGLLSPHGRVRAGERQGRFDDIVGLGFVLVSRSGAAEGALGERQRAFLDALGGKRVVVVEEGEAAETAGALVDLDRRFTAYMRQHGIDTMLVRPDFYLYGAVAEAGEVNRLVDDLAADLARHGVRLAAAREREAVAG
jgi:hypothetical protein